MLKKENEKNGAVYPTVYSNLNGSNLKNIKPIDFSLVCSPHSINRISSGSRQLTPVNGNFPVQSRQTKNMTEKALPRRAANVKSVGTAKRKEREIRSFLRYMLTKNNAVIFVVLILASTFLILSSFMVNRGENETIVPPEPPEYKLNASGEAYSASNPAFEHIKQDVRFYIHDGYSGIASEVVLPFMTIGEALEQAGITLEGEDSLNYPQEYFITDNMLVEITRIKNEVIQKNEIIPFETKIIEVDTIKKGTTQVVKKGVNGTLAKYYEQIEENGKISGEKFLSQQITAQPVTEIVCKGVGGTITGADGKAYKYSYVIEVDAVAYGDISEGKNPNWTGITYTGMKCVPGVLAVDPTVIPLHSKVYVTGSYGDYGVCYAADTGSAIKGNIIDIYMESKAEMLSFGRRAMKAYILE